jgi:hypothetical protein
MTFLGQFDLTISNAWTGTKLLLDPQLKEIRVHSKVSSHSNSFLLISVLNLHLSDT